MLMIQMDSSLAAPCAPPPPVCPSPGLSPATPTVTSSANLKTPIQSSTGQTSSHHHSKDHAGGGSGKSQLKRKLFSPQHNTPSGAAHDDDDGRKLWHSVSSPGSGGKRRRSSHTESSPTPHTPTGVTPGKGSHHHRGGGTPGSGGAGTPGGHLTVPLSERQQMALILQMSAEETNHTDPASSAVSPRPSSPQSAGKKTPLERRVNKQNGKGETPLHTAAINGDQKQTKKLIKAGADVNIKDYAGWTPLHEACNRGHLDVVKQLLKAGATVNAQGLENDTPLHDAAINGHAKVVELLLRHGANPAQANAQGKCPVDCAASDAIRRLLRNDMIASSSGSESGHSDIRSPTSPESNGVGSDEENKTEESGGMSGLKKFQQTTPDSASLLSLASPNKSSSTSASDYNSIMQAAGLHTDTNISPGRRANATSAGATYPAPVSTVASSLSPGSRGAGGSYSNASAPRNNNNVNNVSSSHRGGSNSNNHQPRLSPNSANSASLHSVQNNIPRGGGSVAPPVVTSSFHQHHQSSHHHYSSSTGGGGNVVSSSQSQSHHQTSSVLSKVRTTHYVDKSQSPRFTIKYQHIKEKKKQQQQAALEAGSAPPAAKRPKNDGYSTQSRHQDSEDTAVAEHQHRVTQYGSTKRAHATSDRTNFNTSSLKRSHHHSSHQQTGGGATDNNKMADHQPHRTWRGGDASTVDSETTTQAALSRQQPPPHDNSNSATRFSPQFEDISDQEDNDSQAANLPPSSKGFKVTSSSSDKNPYTFNGGGSSSSSPNSNASIATTTTTQQRLKNKHKNAAAESHSAVDIAASDKQHSVDHQSATKNADRYFHSSKSGSSAGARNASPSSGAVSPGRHHSPKGLSPKSGDSSSSQAAKSSSLSTANMDSSSKFNTKSDKVDKTGHGSSSYGRVSSADRENSRSPKWDSSRASPKPSSEQRFSPKTVQAPGGQTAASSGGHNNKLPLKIDTNRASPKPSASSSDRDSPKSGDSSDRKVPPLKIIIPPSKGEKERHHHRERHRGGGGETQPYVVNPTQEGAAATSTDTPTVSIAGDAASAARGTAQTQAQTDKPEFHGDEAATRRVLRGGCHDDDSRGSTATGPSEDKENGAGTEEQRRLTRSQARSGRGAGNKDLNNDDESSLDGEASNMSSSASVPAVQTPASANARAPAIVCNKPAQPEAAPNLGNTADELAAMHPRKRKLRQRQLQKEQESSGGAASELANFNPFPPTKILDRNSNPYEMFLDIRKKILRRQSEWSAVQPKPPAGFHNYLMVSCNYVLAGNAASKLAVPTLSVPNSLGGPDGSEMSRLFQQQEQARYRLRLQHVIEKEKLCLSIEQETLRVHGRAARAAANQSATPLSACSILCDQEVYNPIADVDGSDKDPVDKDKHAQRQRYNGRQFLSWLQDVDDKFEKIKESLLLRHHHEAESLHAVQKLEWEWKLRELGLLPASGAADRNGAANKNKAPQIDELHVPMVAVLDEFDLLPS